MDPLSCTLVSKQAHEETEGQRAGDVQQLHDVSSSVELRPRPDILFQVESSSSAAAGAKQTKPWANSICIHFLMGCFVY